MVISDLKPLNPFNAGLGAKQMGISVIHHLQSKHCSVGVISSRKIALGIKCLGLFLFGQQLLLFLSTSKDISIIYIKTLGRKWQNEKKGIICNRTI